MMLSVEIVYYDANEKRVSRRWAQEATHPKEVHARIAEIEQSEGIKVLERTVFEIP